MPAACANPIKDSMQIPPNISRVVRGKISFRSHLFDSLQEYNYKQSIFEVQLIYP